MPDNKGKKGKISQEAVNNVAYSALSRLYNQRALNRLKAIAKAELEKSEETTSETTQLETEAEIVEDQSSDETPEMPATE
jgi:hypothetical protein